MKKTSFAIASVIAVSIAGATTGFAAELPSYQAKGLPISPVQASLLGASNAEQAQVAPSAVSPLQISVLTPRHKVNSATVARVTTGVAR